MYQVWGVHPESDCDWLVGIFETEEEAQMAINLIPEEEFDDGMVHYEIRKI